MRLLAAFALVAVVPGCATIIEGSSQSIAIATSPPGANCQVDRQGLHLGTVAPTPGSLHLDKSKNDITVSCTKDGYQPASIAQSPRFGGTTFGNIVAGGIVGVAIDAASGANYSYPQEVRLDLAPLSPPVAPVANMVVPTAPVVRTTSRL
jgi:hypothetical protein